MIEVSKVQEVFRKDVILTPHCHSSIEADFVLRGKGKYAVAEKEYEICPGNVFVFCNNIIHRITHISEEEPMEILKVHFSPSILWENAAFSDFEEILFRTSGLTIIPPDSVYSEKIRTVLEEMLEESASDLPPDRYKSEELKVSRLFTLCVMIARHVQSTGEPYGEMLFRSDNHFAVFSTIDYINSNLQSDLNIDDLARMAQMSKNSYLRWFKHFNGVSPYSYIQSKRILKAIDLLKTGDSTITHIAYECGYNSTVSFNKAFKKVMGCTPSELRKNRSQ